MNIDFHYGVIYATSRIAGLSSEDAKTVAHACQYVDDATTNGLLTFAGGETFERFASAHVMHDYRNALNNENRFVWVPFHFLPGGQGDTLQQKAVCRPNSEIARAMVRSAINARDADNALHRLGVTLHTYVDTWAHQGFSGIISDHNKLHSLEGDAHNHQTWSETLESNILKAGQTITTHFLDAVSGLGHGAALHFPDMPWARWKYRNYVDNVWVERDNLTDFITAADMACKVVQAFSKGFDEFEGESGLGEETMSSLKSILSNNTSHDPEERLTTFREAISSGQLNSFQEHIPLYIAKGSGSWKHAATGISDTGDGQVAPEWTPTFEVSDYRKFHDAVKEHRLEVTHRILPSFNVRLV